MFLRVTLERHLKHIDPLTVDTMAARKVMYQPLVYKETKILNGKWVT